MESGYIWVGNNKEGWVRWLIPWGIVRARNRTIYMTIQDKDFVLCIGKSYIIKFKFCAIPVALHLGLYFEEQKFINNSKSAQGKK